MAGFSWLSVTTKVMWGSLLPTRDDETQTKGRVSESRWHWTYSSTYRRHTGVCILYTYRNKRTECVYLFMLPRICFDTVCRVVCV